MEFAFAFARSEQYLLTVCLFRARDSALHSTLYQGEAQQQLLITYADPVTGRGALASVPGRVALITYNGESNG